MADPDPPRPLPIRPRTPRHIVETMEEPGMGKPLPALPIATLAFPPLPIPLSNFSTFSRRPSKNRMKVRCLHSVMTRFYSTRDKCDKCKREGAFGWLYRCILDRDAMIMARKANGISVVFDGLGCTFSKNMTLGKHGPDARHEDYSFFNEITPGQMASYTPSQIRKILRQRENVKNTIAEERRRSYHPGHEHAKKRFPDDNQPWMPSRETECRFTVCHNCHPSATEKNRTSIDAVAEDDIRPTVAVGYGFSKLQSRPYAKAEIVRNIGYRPVPLPINRSGHPSAGAWSSIQSDQALDIADRYSEAVVHDGTSDDRIEVTPGPSYCSSPLVTPRNSQGMAGSSTDTFGLAYTMGSSASSSFPVRPPWTPPPIPLRTAEDGAIETETLTAFGSYFDLFNGRSPISLKVNPIVRNTVLSSVTDSPFSQCQRETENMRPEADFELLDEDEIPIQTKEYNPSPIQHLKSHEYVEACTTPLPPADPDEISFLSNRPLPTNPSLRRHRSQYECGRGQRPLNPTADAEEDKDTTPLLISKPITLYKSIAITEEAAELGTSNVCPAVDIQPITPAYPSQGDESFKF